MATEPKLLKQISRNRSIRILCSRTTTSQFKWKIIRKKAKRSVNKVAQHALRSFSFCLIYIFTFTFYNLIILKVISFSTKYTRVGMQYCVHRSKEGEEQDEYEDGNRM